MSEVKVTCNLAGLKRNYWRRNLKGFFCLDDGTELSDAQVRRIVEYGIKNGYRTEADIPIDAIAHLLNLPTTDNKKKEEATQQYLFTEED